MRGLVAKVLRREALQEMIVDGVPKRDLVELKSGSMINSPSSIRAMYLKLKAAYSRMRRFGGEVKLAVDRARNPSKIRKAQPDDRIAAIQKPLDFILQHCPPSKTRSGGVELHPVYAAARHAANRGRGDLVKKMALQFLPA
jgi:hypothetical protein